jgi:catechol 2,3-dioxygenase-like lactoylglutathione lyase family enzyme
VNVLGKMIGFAVTTKPEEAKAFYGEKLGFQFVKDDGYALVFDANGTMLRVAKMQHFTAPQFTILGWEVSDISTMVGTLPPREYSSSATTS